MVLNEHPEPVALTEGALLTAACKSEMVVGLKTLAAQWNSPTQLV
jgi:hypothetical protein